MNKVTLQTRVNNHPLVTRLLESIDALEPAKLEQLWNAVGNGQAPIESTVIECGLANERQLAESYSRHYLIPMFEPPTHQPPPVDPAVASILPESYCRHHQLAPLSDTGDLLEVALFYPDKLQLADEIRELTGRQMRPMFTTPQIIEQVLDAVYASGPAEKLEFIESVQRSCQLEATAHEPDQEVTRYLKRLLDRAIKWNASDIHFERSENGCRIRVRVGDALQGVSPSPNASFEELLNGLGSFRKKSGQGRAQNSEISFRIRCGRQRFLATLDTSLASHPCGAVIHLSKLAESRAAEKEGVTAKN